MSIKITANAELRSTASASDTPLLYVLCDDLELRGPKFGCGLSQCGACAVLVDGTETRSCVTPTAPIVGKQVTAWERLPAWHAKQKRLRMTPALHPLQQAWIDEHVPQCGYCQSGMIIMAAANPQRDRARNQACRQFNVLSNEGLRLTPHGHQRFSRSALLKGGGALIVAIGAPATFCGIRSTMSDAPRTWPAVLRPSALDSWLAAHADGTVTAFTTKTDPARATRRHFRTSSPRNSMCLSIESGWSWATQRHVSTKGRPSAASRSTSPVLSFGRLQPTDGGRC